MFTYEEDFNRLVFVVLVGIILLMLSVAGLFVHYAGVRADLQTCEENRHASTDFS